MLGQRFDEAAAYARHAHAADMRKGTTIPYLSHLLAVAALVLEAGGDEDQAIGALLHDVVEDGGGLAALDEIRERFGERVAEIVLQCSDSTGDPKPPHRQRKQDYLASIRAKPRDAALVTLADKLHNARSILGDYREHREALWDRFTPGSDQLWYYRSLVDAFRISRVSDSPLLDELARTVAELEQLVHATRRGLAQSGEARPGLAHAISAAFAGGTLDFSARPGAPTPGWSAMPEVVAFRTLREAGLDEASFRYFATFVTALDRARDSLALWTAAARLVLDNMWLIDPAEVVTWGVEELADVLRVGGVSQRHGPDSQAWARIGRSLAESAAPAVNRAIEEGTGDALELLAALDSTGPLGEALFPLLRGPKIGTVWVRILAHPGGAELSSLHRLPVAVDVHVRRVTERLAVTATADQPLDRARVLIQEAWLQDVNEGGAAGPGNLAGTCAALDPALWLVGKWGCAPCDQAGRRIPVGDFCNRCLLPG